MNVIYFMIPIALLLSLGFVGAFIWATKEGQWEDLDLAPRKALLDQTILNVAQNGETDEHSN